MSKILQPMVLNNSFIPTPVKTEVTLKITPTSSVYFFVSFSSNSSSLNKSFLFATKAITKNIIIKTYFWEKILVIPYINIF